VDLTRNALFIAVLLLLAPLASAAEIDLRQLTSSGDLDYKVPASRSEEGEPIGNGTMGSLVWTTPTQLKFQINRVDVFGEDCSTHSFPERDSDYASGCGFVDIDVADDGSDVFTGPAFNQHLSIYDGQMTVRGVGVSARLVAAPNSDFIVVQINDERPQPRPIHIDLRMLRYAIQYLPGRNYQLAKAHSVEVRTRDQSATSRLDISDSGIALLQEFREAKFYDASAVVIDVVGRASKARFLNDNTVELIAPAGQGKFTILIGSSASFDPKADVEAAAFQQLEMWENALASAADWWRDFWSRGFVRLHSADGNADLIQQNYLYYLYVMASCSRGKYPPRFGGMLWYTNGDMREWGSEYWWANMSAYYNNLLSADRPELLDPVFSMYGGMYDSCARAARQEWGSQGIYIPETVWFDGLDNLPDDIAAEMRDLYLVRKPWAQRSQRFMDYAATAQPDSSRWNWIDKGRWVNGQWVFTDKGGGPFGHTTHILGVAARIACLFWDRYQCTLDENWLRERAYPMLKGAVEFYRNFPNFGKDADGLYHIHHINNGERSWDVSDTVYELTAMHMVFPAAIEASEILGVDADLRSKWQEINDHLAPMPTQRRPPSIFGPFAFVSSSTSGAFGGDAATTRPIGAIRRYRVSDTEPFETRTVSVKDALLRFDNVGGFVDNAGVGGPRIFANRMRLREGPGAIDCEHLGGLANGLHTTLLKSQIDSQGRAEIEVFPLWPRDWDAQFKLLAKGAVVVSASLTNGKVESVELTPRVDGVCVLKNPWGQAKATIFRDGVQSETVSGPTFEIDMKSGQNITIRP
jgi:hypothetical protein